MDSAKTNIDIGPEVDKSFVLAKGDRRRKIGDVKTKSKTDAIEKSRRCKMAHFPVEQNGRFKSEK